MFERNDIYDLKELINDLCKQFSQIKQIYIFGSRRYRTRSTRSDVDLLIIKSDYLSPEKVRDFALEKCPFLDFFIEENGKAISCANNSYVSSSSTRQLIKTLDCLLVWDIKKQFSNDEKIDWQFETLKGFEPTMSTIINVKNSGIASKTEAIASTDVPEIKRKWSLKEVFENHPLRILIEACVLTIIGTVTVISFLIINPLKDEINHYDKLYIDRVEYNKVVDERDQIYRECEVLKQQISEFENAK